MINLLEGMFLIALTFRLDLRPILCCIQSVISVYIAAVDCN
jgi:hypothetical protein